MSSSAAAPFNSHDLGTECTHNTRGRIQIARHWQVGWWKQAKEKYAEFLKSATTLKLGVLTCVRFKVFVQIPSCRSSFSANEFWRSVSFRRRFCVAKSSRLFCFSTGLLVFMSPCCLKLVVTRRNMWDSFKIMSCNISTTATMSLIAL